MSPNEMWELVMAIERAAWKRSWRDLKLARRALEKASVSKRPHAIITMEVASDEETSKGSDD